MVWLTRNVSRQKVALTVLALVTAACAKIASHEQGVSDALMSAAPSNTPQELIAPSNVPGTSTPPVVVNPPRTTNTSTDKDGGYIPNPDGDSDGDDGGYIPQRPAQLVVTPPVFDFGIKSINSINHLVLTVTNIGEVTATGMTAGSISGVFQFRDGVYPGTLGNCQNQLAPGASCRLMVSFRPAAASAYSANLIVSHSKSDVIVPLRGRGTGIATLKISNLINDNAHYNYGQIAFGTNVVKTFRVIYSGVKPATGVTFSGVTAPYAIVRNSCGETVTADCDLDIEFSASQAGLQQRKLKVTYHNSSYSAEANHELYGEASPQTIPATLTIDSHQFGDVLAGREYEKILRVRKLGNLPASNVRALSFHSNTFSFKGGSFPGAGGTCEAQITSDCLLVVLFKPTVNGAYSDRVVFDFHNGIGQASAANTLHGRAVDPALVSIRPAADFSFDFGEVSTGYPKDQVYIVENSAGRLAAAALSFGAMNPGFSRVYSNCGSSLASGRTCQVTVRFTPTSESEFLSPLEVRYHDGVEARRVSANLVGRGSAGATLTFGGNTYDFGTVVIGQTTYIDVEIRYYGRLVAEGCQIVIRDPSGGGGDGPVFQFPNGNPYEGGTCRPGGIDQRCTFRIIFSPAREFIYRTELTLTYQTGTGTTDTIVVPVLGKGSIVSPAVLSSRSPVDFGQVAVGGSKNAVVRIARAGQLTATAISAAISGTGFAFLGGSFPGQGGTCETQLPLHLANCDLVLSFAPAAHGAATGSLQLDYHDGTATRSLQLQLRGEGHRAAHLAMMGLSFGKLPIGGSAQLSTTIVNTGTETASSIALKAAVAPFQVLDHDCIDSLAPRDSCQVRVRISSQTPGAYQSTISADYFDGNKASTVTAPADAKATVPVMVAVNGHHSCVRTELGKVKCWGHGAVGQLGLGDSSNRGDVPNQMGPSLPAVNLGSSRWAKAVALGYWHTCAITNDDKVRCWGLNAKGQLGAGSTAVKIGTRPEHMGDALTEVALGEPVVQVAAGYQHTCALTSAGRVACWGDNSEGQLGLGHTETLGTSPEHLSQAWVQLEAAARSISAGPSHSCALLTNGALKCWGNNLYGQLATGDSENHGDDAGEVGTAWRDIALGDGRRVTDVAAGGAFTCAVDVDRNVRCWGRNENGVLGATWCQDSGAMPGACDDNQFVFSLPGWGISLAHLDVAFPTINLASDFQAKHVVADNDFSCALSESGAVKCWGANHFGQLGLGDVVARGTDARQMGTSLPSVNLGGAARQITVGGGHACAVLTDESIRCWGHNKYGGLGAGDTLNRGDDSGESPVNVLY